MVIKRTSHAVYDTSYHLVWCPKYRKNIFEREEVKERAVQLIREISEQIRNGFGDYFKAVFPLTIIVTRPVWHDGKPILLSLLQESPFLPLLPPEVRGGVRELNIA